MDKRDQLLKESLIHFLHQGIRQVKISDLTKGLNVSSKTLYQYFGDKEGLVAACFQLYLHNTTAEFERWNEVSENVAELMVNFYRSALYSLTRVNPSFFRDLAVSFPQIWNSDSAFGLSHAKFVIGKGMQQGIFVSKLDCDLCAHTLTYLMRSALEKEPFASESPERQFSYVLWPYVRGMCTSHGREVFRQYQMG